MSDSKEKYSRQASDFVNNQVPNLERAKELYDSAKRREARFNDRWKKRSVNINEIVAEFAPGAEPYQDGVKAYFEGPRYIVMADMAAGYLRIWDKRTKSYTRLDGTPSKNRDATHFKILKREEM